MNFLTILIIFSVHFILGFITHFLMYIKYRAAIEFKIKYNPLAYYDMLDKSRADPISSQYHGLLVILNGSLSFTIYVISQLYWTVYLSLKYLWDRYVLKQQYVRWKHYCLRYEESYTASIQNKFGEITRREVRQDVILKECMHGYESNIDWSKLIKFDSNDNIYFRGVLCNDKELYTHIRTIVSRFNHYCPIKSFDDL